jgi:hypothetical protein
VSREFIIGGRGIYQHALSFYAWCLKDNHWPDYDERADNHIDGWAVIEPDPYMAKNWPGALPTAANTGEDDLIP